MIENALQKLAKKKKGRAEVCDVAIHSDFILFCRIVVMKILLAGHFQRNLLDDWETSLEKPQLEVGEVEFISVPCDWITLTLMCTFVVVIFAKLLYGDLLYVRFCSPMNSSVGPSLIRMFSVLARMENDKCDTINKNWYFCCPDADACEFSWCHCHYVVHTRTIMCVESL